MAMLGRFGEWRLLSAVVATSFVSGTIFGVMPMIVGALMDEFQISHSLAALAITVEIGAAGIAIVLVSGFAGIMRRLPVALWAVGAFVLFGILSMITDNYWVLLGARAMVGFATGIVTVINGASEAASREPDRLMSLTMIVGMSAMALLLRILPELTPLYGIDAVYGAMVLLAIVFLPFYIHIPKAPREGAPWREAVQGMTRKTAGAGGALLPILLMLVMVFIQLAEASAWAFIERKAISLDITGARQGTLLMIVFLASIPGPLFGSIFGTRFGRTWPFMLGMVGHTIGLYLAMTATSEVMLGFGLFLWSVTFVLAMPFYFGALAELDVEGRWISIAMAVSVFCNTFGPLFGGWVLDDAENFDGLMSLTMSLQVLGLTLGLPVFLRVERVLALRSKLPDPRIA